MTEPARARNPRGSGATLRAEIVTAAVRLIDTTGDEGALSLRGIAREAGVSAPAIYPHFADLLAVREALLAWSFDELASAVGAAIAGEGDDPAAALIAAAKAYVRFGWLHRARFRLMFAADGFAPNAVAPFALVESALERCVRSGASASSDAHSDAILLWFALHGVATLQKPTRPEQLRLGPIDRAGAIATLVHRLARLAGEEGL